MMPRLIFAVACLGVTAAWAHGHPVAVGDDMPDAEKIRFCERIRDHALQALYSRDHGRPMKLFAEDGSDGVRIANHVTRRIYEEPQISSPKKADAFGRATCNEMMGSKGRPD